MVVKSNRDVAALREGGAFLASALKKVISAVAAGKKTHELDEIAEREIRAIGGHPSFKGYRTRDTKMPYPASLCVSVNDEIVHGIPGERVLREGDILGLDVGMEYKGFFTDMAVTVPVGKVNDEAQRLIAVTKKALDLGVGAAKAGGRIGDIGEAIQKFVEREGFRVVRELVGHGVGRAVHEEPEVPNWGRRGSGAELAEGMVLALEPMVVAGSPKVVVSKDGWVWSTADGKPAAHFEHTILITKIGAEVITK